MSASSQTASVYDATVDLPQPAAPADIDRTCGVPVLFLALGSLKWLVIALVFWAISSAQLFAPGFLSGCPWLTYGKIAPAFTHCLYYGFAIQGALAVGLWLLARLGRTWLAHGPFAIAGAVFLNLGVLAGLIAILAGYGSGHEGLDMPGYAAVIIFAGFSLVAFSAIWTMNVRRERRLHPTQTVLLISLLWFPWILGSASMLLHFFPVRGVLQALVNWWYVNNLVNVVLALNALGILFYFGPLLRGKPLHSRELAAVTTWILTLFGGWMGVPLYSPLPAWIGSVSVAATIFCAVGLMSFMVNQMKSCGGTPFDWLKDRTLKFLLFSGMSFVFGSLLRITGSLGPVNEVVQFSLYQSGVHFLLTFGVFGLSCIGALYFIVPKLLGHEWPSTGLVKLHHLLTIGGVLLTGVALCVGGYWQGKALNLGKTSLIEIGQNLKPFLGLNLVASLMLLAGSVVFLGHFAWACFRAARHCCWSDTCCKGGQP